jgi:tetratricopeptide (TPR) repeat protein
MLPVLAGCVMFMLAAALSAQEVGGDLGGSTGIFRPKNPETKRRTPRNLRPVTKPVAKPGAGTPGGSRRPALTPAEIEERVEDALDDGNEARDARKYAEAEKAYREAYALKANDARATYGLGNVYTDQQRWDDAEKAYRQASGADPRNADVLVALSYVLVQPRTAAGNARRFADAEQFARRAIQLQESNAIAYDRLGAALEARGIFNADTEQAYRKAVELDPQFAVGHVHLARLLRRSNRASEAEPLYKRATDLAKDAPTLVLIADALQSEQRWDDSEPVLRRALELDARNPGALFLLGRMFTVKRNYAEAETFLKRAIEISPRSFQPYNILATAYLGAERYEDAEQTYVRAAEHASAGDRKQLAGAYGLGGVGDGYMKAGRAADAVRAYGRALQLDPANTELQGKLADARGKIK